jgi:hypothetical protein
LIKLIKLIKFIISPHMYVVQNRIQFYAQHVNCNRYGYEKVTIQQRRNEQVNAAH